MAGVDRTWRVADIVTAHPECAGVFGDHRIDFCFHGERSLDAGALSTPELISYIVTRHHAYLYAAFPFIERLLVKVMTAHGPHEPRLLALREAFRRLSTALQSHLYEEEAVLFPALRAQPNDWCVIAEERAAMKQEHLVVGARLAAVRALAGDYAVPDGVCASYRPLMRELAVLEANTMRHIHLETHVLMSRFDGRTTAPR
jgi:regulator of cell morphogenesis and NO signaling